MRFVTSLKTLMICAASAVAMATPAVHAQQVVATYTGGTETATFFPGQSFTISGTAASYSNLTFNFYDATLAPIAVGTLYLFTQAYGGTPSGLAATAVARATAANGLYSFGPTLSFTNGTQLFAYADTSFSLSGNGAGTYSGGSAYLSSSSTTAFSILTGQDANFRVQASVVAVPEPATWSLMLAGFGAVGYSMRRRRWTVAAA